MLTKEHKDPVEAFQIATCLIAEGDYKGALDLLNSAAAIMSDDPDFQMLISMCRRKCAA